MVNPPASFHLFRLRAPAKSAGLGGCRGWADSWGISSGLLHPRCPWAVLPWEKTQCLLDCLQLYRTELNISKTAAFCKGTICQGPALGSCPADEVCCRVPAPAAWDPHATASPPPCSGLPASALSPLQGKRCPRLPNLHLKPSASHRRQGAGASPYYFSYPVTTKR